MIHKQSNCVEYDVPENNRYSILQNGRITKNPESKYFYHNFIGASSYLGEKRRSPSAEEKVTFRMGLLNFKSLTLFELSFERPAG